MAELQTYQDLAISHNCELMQPVQIRETVGSNYYSGDRKAFFESKAKEVQFVDKQTVFGQMRPNFNFLA